MKSIVPCFHIFILLHFGVSKRNAFERRIFLLPQCALYLYFCSCLNFEFCVFIVITLHTKAHLTRVVPTVGFSQFRIMVVLKPTVTEVSYVHDILTFLHFKHYPIMPIFMIKPLRLP